MGDLRMTMNGKPISMKSVKRSIRKRTGANNSRLSDQRLDAAVKKQIQQIMDENQIVKKRTIGIVPRKFVSNRKPAGRTGGKRKNKVAFEKAAEQKAAYQSKVRERERRRPGTKQKTVKVDTVRALRRSQQIIKEKKQDRKMDQLASAVEIRKIVAAKMLVGELLHDTVYVNDMELIEANIRPMAAFLRKVVQDRLRKVKGRVGGHAVYAQMSFAGENGTYNSAVFRSLPAIMDEDNVLRTLLNKTGKTYNNETYTVSLISIKIIVTPLGRAGGCADKTLTKKVYLKPEYAGMSDRAKTRRDYYKAVSLKSRDNNCAIQCFIYACGLKGNQVKPSGVRKKVGLLQGTKVDIGDLDKLAKYFNKAYVLYNQEDEQIAVSDKQPGDPLLLKLENDHYFVLEHCIFKTCQKCFTRYADKHNCNVNVESFVKTKLKKGKRDIVNNCRTYEREEVDYDRMMHVDFETFQESYRHVVYAVGMSVGSNYSSLYGKDAFSQFMDVLQKCEDMTINAYNGSSFDYYFIIDELTKRGIEVTDIIYNSGKVLSFKFGTCKFFDLFLFLNCSLKKACESFDLQNTKSEFDHTKIKNWEDVLTHQQEVEPYLKLDVICLAELFQTFNNQIFNMQKVNITNYLTISHAGYELWRGTIGQTRIELPCDKDKYPFIKAGTYGPRTYPLKQAFESEMYEEVSQNLVSYQDVMDSEDFVYNADVSGLYGGAMAGVDFCPVKYPAGESEWVQDKDDAQKAFEAGTIGMYTIRYDCPKDIRYPVLPKRSMNGGISWDLDSHEGVYTSVDIENAKNCGYEIEFVGRALTWTEECTPFTKFVNKWNEVKEKAEQEGKTAKRAIAKLMINSLYGKMLMRPITTTTAIVHTVQQFNEFCSKYDLCDWEAMSSDNLLVTGEIPDVGLSRIEKVNKPVQMGAFILSYTRRIMLHFVKACDPTLRDPVFLYTDTDSLHIPCKHYQTLKEKGLIVDKKNSKMGYLCSDIANEGLIVSAKYYSPKCYAYEYINDKGERFLKNDGTMKTKGIPQAQLEYEMFESGKARTVEFDSLKKVNTRVTKKQRESGVTAFSIINSHATRTWNKSEWKGMKLVSGEYYPHHYAI
jgi:hypothetical protein